LKCSSQAGGNLVEDLPCQLNGYRITIEVKLADSVKVANGGYGIIRPRE